ncbi:MAG: polyribonucleotide nucleotidyltransferase, partial [Candidatus Omnitrophica bacterium]|nr:polyribonucleotide nucleotidyltransferase [Candidatus Omnitrophota bacterium]
MKRFETDFGKEKLIIETGKLAKQASGSCTVQMGGTVVLVTCVASKKAREGIDFFPLFVEYQEKTYAAGKIPGGFFKREGRPSSKEILTARLIDRPIRPLFPKGMANEVQVMSIVLSSDTQNDSDILALIGASCALSISNIPFEGPVGAVRIGRINDEFVVNPTYTELVDSTIDLVVAGTREGVIMLEGQTKEIEESILEKAIEKGHAELKPIIDFIDGIAKECGSKKFQPILKKIDPELLSKVEEIASSQLDKINAMASKEERIEAFDLLLEELVGKFVTEGGPHKAGDVKSALSEVEKDRIRKAILDDNKRVDGRGFTDLRNISCEIGVLPRTHGTGLFTRGQTQSLAVTTLGSADDEQMIDALEEKTYKSFMLHYNFPPFSVGEVKPVRGPGRREIGHGALAEKALKAVMPQSDEFPYTIRLVSEVLESNGSSSMATVCAGTLSLMDAGVPIKAAVSGVALGLVKKGDKEVVLTDIGGAEDHYGDMDFKVAGTEKGINAIQMDLKISGVSLKLIKKALGQSHDARLEILEKMKSVIAKPKDAISEYAPKIATLKIDVKKIGELIGPGGKNIKKITADTGATINIEDDGTVQIAAVDTVTCDKALEIVKKLTEDVEVGKIYNGKVKRIMNFGAFCEILPNKEGLVHVSELDEKFIDKIDDVIKVGDEFQVRVIEVDPQGRINLSKKQVLGEYTGPREKPQRHEKRGRS